MLFKDRKDAGRQLLLELTEYQNKKDTLVIALPRGGVVVGHEIAQGLGLPLDIIIPRKIGAPFNEELAIGSLIGDLIFINGPLVSSLGISKEYLNKTIDKEKEIARHRVRIYREQKTPLKVKHKTIILVDDGIATGYTISAAIAFLKKEEAKSIIVAVPVAPRATIERLKSEVQKVICLYHPESFFAIGAFYDAFAQVEDDEVISILKQYPQ